MANNLAFLGIGLMGKPMSLRLQAAGFKVKAWNRSQEKLQTVRDAGVATALTVQDVVAEADLVISMLDNGKVVRAVAEQAMDALKPGSLWIDMSSTGQDEACESAALLRHHGVRFIDAPVSGGVAGAEQGNLAIMAGGSIDDFTDAQVVFAVLGRASHVGPVGCGQLAKLCNQLIVGATLNVVAEALLLAEAGGADPAAVRAAIRGGFAESRILEVHGQRMLERNFVAGGQVKSQAKDMDNILRAAQAVKLELPLTRLVAERYHELLNDMPQADHSAALIALERLNPGIRLGELPDRI